MNRHSEESSTLTRPSQPAGAPRSGKQARSVAKRLVLPGPLHPSGAPETCKRARRKLTQNRQKNST